MQQTINAVDETEHCINGSIKSPMSMETDVNLYKQDAQTPDDANELDATLKEINETISTIVGLEAVKDQLKIWMKGLLLFQRRKALGIKVGAPKIIHMAFLGNPGTGKTMVAQIVGKLLHKLGLVSTDKVVEVQRTDLIGRYIGETGIKTREKIETARGGVLFIDEAYRLMPPNDSGRDFGREALEEIMSAMDKGDTMIIFAGYSNEMKRVFTANAGFTRRVSKIIHFEDYTPKDVAMIMLSKFEAQEKDSHLQGFKLHQEYTVNAIAGMISKHIPDEILMKMNGGLVNPWLVNALENLDLRLNVKCSDVDVLTTITMKDLEQGLESLHKSITTESHSMEKAAIQKSSPDTVCPTTTGADTEKKSPAKKQAPIKKAVKRESPAKVEKASFTGKIYGKEGSRTVGVRSSARRA